MILFLLDPNRFYGYDWYFYFMYPMVLVSQGLLIVQVSQPHGYTLHSVGLLWTSFWPIEKTQPDNTQHLQDTDIHAPGGNRTCNPRKRVSADPLLRPRGHWNPHNAGT